MNGIYDKLKKKRKELKQARQGTHKELTRLRERIRAAGKEELAEAETRYQISKRTIEETYKRREESYKEEYLAAVRTLKDDLLKEVDESERIVELEFSTAEIGKINYVNPDNGKKTLRGRGGGDLIVPPSYLNANPKPSTPNLAQTAQFLLSEAEIAADLRAISKTTEVTSPIKGNRRIDVQLSKQKMTYDSRAFKQNEEVMVENTVYGKFAARIEQINDTVVIFKATLGWDTRQIHASAADLQEARVVIHKKRAT